MVSPWMKNGDVLAYVRKYPDVDRKYLVSLPCSFFTKSISRPMNLCIYPYRFEE